MAAELPLNVEVLGERSLLIRVQPAGEATKRLFKSETVVLLGYVGGAVTRAHYPRCLRSWEVGCPIPCPLSLLQEWQFFVYKDEEKENVQLTICCSEFYDEYHHRFDFSHMQQFSCSCTSWLTVCGTAAC